MQQGYYAYSTGWYTPENTYVCTHLIPCTENTTYTFRCINTGGGSKNYGYVFFDSARNRIYSDYTDRQTEGDVVTRTVTTPPNTAFLAIDVAYGRRQERVVRPSDITDFMLNLGSTALPYEPYGYKISVKLVFTGSADEGWSAQAAGGGATRFRYAIVNSVQADIAHVTSTCTHLPLGVEGGTWNTDDIYTISNNYLWLRLDSNFTTISALKTWLAAQYAASTPVTVWYVLATPETGIVNEPLMKIGDYADTVTAANVPTTGTPENFDVGTTLKPSEVQLTYHGWHEHTDTKYTE